MHGYHHFRIGVGVELIVFGAVGLHILFEIRKRYFVAVLVLAVVLALFLHCIVGKVDEPVF